jgi:hypothetical protein
MIDELRALARAIYRDTGRPPTVVEVGHGIMAAIVRDMPDYFQRFAGQMGPDRWVKIDGVRVVERRGLGRCIVRFEKGPER